MALSPSVRRADADDDRRNAEDQRQQEPRVIAAFRSLLMLMTGICVVFAAGVGVMVPVHMPVSFAGIAVADTMAVGDGLLTSDVTGTVVGVGVAGIAVGVADGLIVGSGVTDGTGVAVGVTVGSGVAVGTGVAVGVTVGNGVAVGFGVHVGKIGKCGNFGIGGTDGTGGTVGTVGKAVGSGKSLFALAKRAAPPSTAAASKLAIRNIIVLFFMVPPPEAFT
jgi:hypothetical protein